MSSDSEDYVLHVACSSPNPLSEEIVYEEVINEIVQVKGLCSFKTPNSIGITPMQYLNANPFAEINEQRFINRYILDMMGESVMS